MNLFKLISSDDQEARPAQPSRVVAVNTDGGRGVALWHTSDSDIAFEIEQTSHLLDDLGLDDAPVGISIWEGSYVWRPGGYECPQDGSTDPVGSFRAPTDEEWQAIREGRNPWS